MSPAPDVLLARRLLSTTAVVACLAFVTLAALQWKVGNTRLSAAQSVAALLTLVLIVVLPRTRRTDLLGHALIVLVSTQITVINVLYGGVKPTALAFFAVSPLVALLAAGPRAAVVWFVLDAAIIVGLNVAQVMGVPFPPPPPPNRWVDAVALILLTAVALSFLSAHVTLSRQALARLREANDELVQARRRAEEAGAAKDRLVATVSHELRTPLTGAIGFSRLLVDAHLPGPQDGYARTALACGETLLALVNDILDRARLSAGKLELQSTAFDLHRLLEEVAAVARVNAVGKKLTVDLAVEVPRWVVGDPVRLKQVLLNLAGNAVKFTAEGTVIIGARAEDDAVRFEVKDTGVGIRAADLPHIFEPFAQAGGTTRRFGGTGLGLSIASEIVAAMGGKIEVGTAEGEGSTFGFRVVLPAGAPADQALRAEQKLQGGLRVLVVDDSPVNRFLATRFLEQIGVAGVAVDSGAAALAALQQSAFDAVLLDVQMPKMDGFETARRIRAREERERGRRIPLIALTASAGAEDVAHALDAGMDDHLGKPFAPEQLVERLAAVTGRAA